MNKNIHFQRKIEIIRVYILLLIHVSKIEDSNLILM